MEPESQLRLRVHLGGLPDADLRRIAALERSEYREDAFQQVLDELARRRLPLLSPDEYWRQFPEEWLEQIGFCHRCWTMTTSESLGVAFPGWRPFGIGLFNERDECRVCGSVTLTKTLLLVFPIARLGRYRVLLDRRPYGDPPRGRRIKDEAINGQ